MFRALSSVATLFLFWLLLSGYFTPFLLCAGSASAIAVVWFARRMDVDRREGHPIHLGPARDGLLALAGEGDRQVGVGRDQDHPAPAAADQPDARALRADRSAPTSAW